jgi:DNA polymerase III subunit delta
MTYAELNRDIERRDIPCLLFLYGEETFLLDRTLERLRDVAVPVDARDFNYNLYHGKETSAETILDTVLTLPVFTARRLVLVKEAQELSAASLDAFLPYLTNPAPETILVFTADKIDGRKKFFQEFKKRGVLVEFKRLYDNQIPTFVQDQARAAGRSLTGDALALFCRRVGSRLQEVSGELNKLFAYLGERTLVDVADVAAVVSDTRAESIFELTNAIGARNQGEAHRLLARLLAEGAVPLVLLTMMVRHFRQLWQTRELLDQGVGVKEIARHVGINPYFVDGLVSQSRRFSPDRYRQIFLLFLEVDLGLKSSGAHPAAMLEKLILDVMEEAGSKSRRTQKKGP